jgi:glycosyltransferase involved in cell wall biosynthesis
MQLLFDTRILTHKTYTGVENYTKNILENIKKSRFSIKLRMIINIAKPKTANKYLAHIWTHFILPFTSGDILFCPANIAPVFVPKSKKLIVTLHDVAFLTYPKSFTTLFRLYYKFIIPINIKRADKIITVSQSSKSEIEKYYPNAKGKVKVIHLGVNSIFKRLEIQKKKQILYVGSMNERKNFSSVLKACIMLNRSDYVLLMVGNFSSSFALDDVTKTLIETAKSNPNIEFKSDVSNDELVKIYNESMLFIFPSFYEGFGLPVLEGMACGAPVVCSDATSLSEVGGDAVVYCDPYDVGDIKEKMEMVLDDEKLQTEMIEKGLERAKQFTWEKSAKKHLEVFKEVLEN